MIAIAAGLLITATSNVFGVQCLGVILALLGWAWVALARQEQEHVCPADETILWPYLDTDGVLHYGACEDCSHTLNRVVTA